MNARTPEFVQLHAELCSLRAENERLQAAQMRNEAALRQSESHLRTMMGNVPVAMGRCNRSGEYLALNERFASCYGRTRNAMLGQAMSTLVGQSEWEKIAPSIERVLKGESAEIEHSLGRPGLGARHLHCSLAPDFASDGSIIGWLIVAHDLTARKEVELKVQRNDLRRRILTDSLSHLLSAQRSQEVIGILMPKVAAHVEAEAFTHFVLPSGADHLILKCHGGLTAEIAQAMETMAVGSSLCGLVAERRSPVIASHLQTALDPRAEPLRQNGFQAYVGVPLIVGNDLLGTLGFASRTKPSFGEEELAFINVVAGYAAIVIDRLRSERSLRESEERFRSLFENNLDAIFSLDCEGRLLCGNPAVSTLSGYGEAELRGQKFSALCVPEFSEQTEAALQRGLHGRAEEFETVMVGKGGQRAELFVSGIPMRLGERTEGLFVIARDVTERKQAQRALMLLNEKLEERVEERTAVVIVAMKELYCEIAKRRRLEEEILVISEREQARIGQDLHDDLGQQLAGMAMFAHLLSSKLSKEAHPQAAQATQLTNFLSQSIASTRDLAKSLFPVELERGGLLLALQDLAHRTTLLTKVKCEVNWKPEFVCEKAAAIHLYRIVQESLSNAIKHGHSTRVTIDCSISNEVPTLCVSDDGVGLKEPSGEREGMGLHLFQYRARLIGAIIEVKNRSPRGCKVTCRLKGHTPESS